MITTYSHNLITRHSDQDFTQNINSVTIFQFLEDARVAMMKDKLFDIAEVHESKILMVLYKCNIKFAKQISFFDEVNIESSQMDVKKVRGVLKQFGRLTKDNSICFEADAYWAYIPRLGGSKDKAVEFASRFSGEADGFLEPIPLRNYPLENAIFPFTSEFETRPYEMDGFNHLNNCVYYSYFETASYQYLKNFIDWKFIFSGEIIFNVTSVQIDFILPVVCFEKLTLSVIPLEINEPEIQLGLVMKDESNQIKSKCIIHGSLINDSIDTKTIYKDFFSKIGKIKI